MKFYAHSIEGKPPEEWHRLEEHLKGTAELARLFASEFGCGEWGYLAGLWHDLGKYAIILTFHEKGGLVNGKIIRGII